MWQTSDADRTSQLTLIEEASERLLGGLSKLTDEQAREPSALPGWSRAHVLTHLARNADGMRNLFTWARTGVVTPMYREPDGRDADINAGSSRTAAELVADVGATAAQLSAAADQLSDTDWLNEIRRRPQLATEPAYELIQARLFEIEFHHVDLNLGYTFADSPTAVIDRALLYTQQRKHPASHSFVAILSDSGRQLNYPPEQDPAAILQVRGTAAAVLGWLTGRSDGADLATVNGDLPTLPAW